MASAGEVWTAEAQIVPAEEDSVETTASTSAFLNRVGANESSVVKTSKDSATVAYFQSKIAAGHEVHVSINYDSMGNIVGADGRHRAVAALRSGVDRIHVHVTRRK